MRKEPTPAERVLWNVLRGRALGRRWFRQVPVGPYIVDFLCRAGRLVIEGDGGTHADPRTDEARTSFLNARGYRVTRFTNRDILADTEGVALAIDAIPEPA